MWPAWKLTSTHQNSDAQRGENRRLRFRDTLFSLLEQAEREHRAKTPRIRMQVEKHAEPEDDIYRQFEDFEIEAEVDGQSTVVHVRTDYKFGPWEAGTGPWAWHGERREGFFFEPNHSLSDFLKGVKSEGVKSEDVRRLRRREITIGSTAVEHLIPPMTITDEVLGPQETGSESRSAYVAKYGTAPTVTLSFTVQRPLLLESKQTESTGHESSKHKGPLASIHTDQTSSESSAPMPGGDSSASDRTVAERSGHEA